MSYLVGVSFRKEHGKDTVADHLVQAWGFKKLAWAGLLKQGINLWHGWDDRHGYGELKEVIDPYWGYSPRTAYEDIGTKLMRDRWMSDFWIKAACRQIDTLLAEGTDVVLCDTRFVNEAEAIKSRGGAVWHVHRPSKPPADPEKDPPSEIGLLGYESFDEVIVNDKTLPDLYQATNRAYGRMRGWE